jgi:hypothetical protein
VASINGIQVKEYIQSLADEGKVRVEKIGSGNWYWSFAQDEAAARERELGALRREVERVQAGLGEMQGRLEGLRERRVAEEAEEMGNGEEGEKGRGRGREGLMSERAGLGRETGQLRGRLAEAEKGRGKSAAAMRAEMAGLRAAAQMWTDNVYVLEGYLLRLAGGDRGVVQGVQAECYGDEFEEGAGLRELAGAGG